MQRLINVKINPLAVMILLSSIFFWGRVDNRIAQESFFQTWTIVLVALCIKNVWVMAFMLWTVFHGYLSGFNPATVSAMTNVAFGGILYLAITTFAKPYMLPRLFKCFLWVVFFNIAWMGLQKAHVLFGLKESFDVWFYPLFPENLGNPSDLLPIGFFCLPAHLGAYVSVIFPIALCFVPWLSWLFLIPIIVSSSSVAVGGAIAGGLFWLYFYRGKNDEHIEISIPRFRRVRLFWAALPFILIAGMLYVCVFDAPTGQFERRFRAWKQTARLATVNLLQGNGLGSFKSGMVLDKRNTVEEFREKQPLVGLQDNLNFLVERKTTKMALEGRIIERKADGNLDIWDTVHNEYLQMLYELGLVGLFIILGYLWDLWKKFAIMPKDKYTITLASCLVVIILNAGINFSFHVARNGVAFLILMALFEMKYLCDMNERPAIA